MREICGNCVWYGKEANAQVSEKYSQVTYGYCEVPLSQRGVITQLNNKGVFSFSPCTAPRESGENHFIRGVYHSIEEPFAQ